MEIAVGHMRTRKHDLLRHRSSCGAHPVMAGLKVVDDVADRPAADAATAVVGDVWREPALQPGAVQIFAGLVAAEEGLRGVTGATMGWPLHQKRTTIPFRR